MLAKQQRIQDLFLLALAMLFFGAAAACPARGQEPAKPPPAKEKPAEIQAGSPLVASGWCAVKSGKSSAQSTPGVSKESAAGPGCDAGVGAALISRGRLSWVAVIGTKTIGTGIAWTAYKATPQFPRSIAVAIGIVSSWDSTGIGHRVYPALGATVSFFGQPKEKP